MRNSIQAPTKPGIPAVEEHDQRQRVLVAKQNLFVPRRIFNKMRFHSRFLQRKTTLNLEYWQRE